MPSKQLVPDCAAPSPVSLVLTFAGTSGEVDLPLTSDYAQNSCWEGVLLLQYGTPADERLRHPNDAHLF